MAHKQRNFIISTHKQPISKSGPLQAMEERLGVPVPEMIFGDNLVRVEHEPTGWALNFTAEAALDLVDKTDRNMLRVAYAGTWSASRRSSSAADIQEIVRPFDWSYSTTYRGSLEPGRGPTMMVKASPSHGTTYPATPGKACIKGQERPGLGTYDSHGDTGSPIRDSDCDGPVASSDSGSSNSPWTPSPIPFDLLKRRDPILFFDEVVLYESELDDNGVSMFTVKVRVMADRMLLLSRLFMRLDNVIVRVRDTRVYVDFLTDEVIREYQAREDTFENVKKHLNATGLLPDAVTVAFRDANQVTPLLPVIEQELEGVCLGGIG